MGNTLDRPQILLKRHFMRETDTQEENLDQGEDFNLAEQAKQDLMAEASALKKEAFYDLAGGGPPAAFHKSPPPHPHGIESFMNFLAHPSLIYENLKINPKGQIILEDVPIANFSHLQIIGTNLISNISEIVPLPRKETVTRDLSLKSQLQSDQFYSISYGNKVLLKDQCIEIKDMTSTELKIVDSLPKLFDI
mmetsp:Transcript_24060/g.21082  ORF Transcript_24060/g.21082 Transcript_24060/m.21082 type:complete len:193 (+) Transcript_24060:181-759(+)